MRLPSILFGVLGLLFLAGTANATVDFSQMVGRGCATCHSDNQTPTRQTVTPVGWGYSDCHFDQTCINQWKASLPAETSRNTVVPTPGPAPVKHTTESWNGMAHLSNRCSNNRSEWIYLRPGKDSAKRDIALILDPGQKIMVVLSHGTVYAYGCGDPPSDPNQFYYIDLEKWVAP